jgi:hypothetical protein
MYQYKFPVLKYILNNNIKKILNYKFNFNNL